MQGMKQKTISDGITKQTETHFSLGSIPVVTSNYNL